jgi:hypothetical protein
MNHDWRVLREIGKLRSEKIAFVGEGWDQPVKRRRLSRAIEGSESEKAKRETAREENSRRGYLYLGEEQASKSSKRRRGCVEWREVGVEQSTLRDERLLRDPRQG